MFGAWTVSDRVERLERTVRAQEATIRLLCERAGVDASSLVADPALSEQERELIDQGKTVNAIRDYRRRTGAPLAEAAQLARSHQGRS